MGHPYLTNSTPFAADVQQHADENARTVLVPIIKATFDIHVDSLELADVQAPINTQGVHWGDPDTTAYKYEPETAFQKPATDVVLIGHAYPMRAGDKRRDVTLQVGELKKTLRVSGNRVWYKSALGIAASEPLPFEAIALSYDLAYGGWDRSHRDLARHHCDQRNPVGRGYRGDGAAFIEGSPLPNVEDPSCLLESYAGKSAPAGFGFTGHNWQPRVRLGGTYDELWAEQRSPMLPRDFQRAFFNAASPGLIAKGYLRGDEPVMLHGTQSGTQPVTIKLPGIVPPVCSVIKRSRATLDIATSLDTLIVDTEQRKLLMLWRGLASVPEGLQGVAEIAFACTNAPARSKPRGARVIPFRSPQARHVS